MSSPPSVRAATTRPAACISNATPASRYASKSSSVRRLSASSARTPASKRSLLQLRRKLQSQRTNAGSRGGRSTNASPPVSSWRTPSRTIPGAGSGYVKLGETQPVLPRETPPPTRARSRTTTSAPRRRSSQAHARPTTPAPTTATRGSLSSVLPVHEPLRLLADVLPEDRMLRHVGRVAAGRNRPAEALGHRADEVRRAAAAEADVADAEVARRGGELGQLEAVALERLERDREAAHAVGVLERLEVGLLGRRPVRHGLRGDVAVDRRPDPLEDRQHRARPARAVEADDVGAGRLQLPARLDEVVSVDRHLVGRD